MTVKEYRFFELNRTPKLVVFLIKIKLFRLVIIDQNIWKNNNDYSCEFKVNIYNPLSYIILLLYIPLAFLINGINPISYRDIKKEIKEQFKNN